MFKIFNRRYTGSKAKLTEWIMKNVDKYCSGESFADIFAGTGVVAYAASKKYKKIILNDLLFSNNIIYKAFSGNEKIDEKKVKKYVDKFNNLKYEEVTDNYFEKNFGNKYFDDKSARKIGFIRDYIEKEKTKLSEKEYNILIASLIYSVDRIANTVGHYDAYFKKTVERKKFIFELIDYEDSMSNSEIYREDANNLVHKIKADIVYIDPPYNSRQYSRFYHVLETLTKWDKPTLYGVAMKPKSENMSEYCKVGARKQFSNLINNLTCKYIVVSYNNTYSSKSNSSKNKIELSFIEKELNNIGKTVVISKSHQFFNAGKTDFKDHKEYLFITTVGKFDKKSRSPLFYVGDKYKIINQIKVYFPKEIKRYIEPFVGGGSSFLNVSANEFILNDIDSNIINLHKFLTEYSNKKGDFFKEIEEKINNYELSYSFKGKMVPDDFKQKYKKTYYAKYNKESYLKLRDDYNNNQNDMFSLYLLLIYGFNHFLRYNSFKQFNLPVGNVDFNKNVFDSLNNYFDFAKENKLKFTNLDYKEFLNKIKLKDGDFIYFDPPYLISNSEYNKLWTENDEQELLNLLDDLNNKGIKFAISNVTHYKSKENQIFINWSKKYKVIKINSNYISYHDNKKKTIREVLVTNYE